MHKKQGVKMENMLIDNNGDTRYTIRHRTTDCANSKEDLQRK